MKRVLMWMWPVIIAGLIFCVASIGAVMSGDPTVGRLGFTILFGFLMGIVSFMPLIKSLREDLRRVSDDRDDLQKRLLEICSEQAGEEGDAKI